MKTDVFNLVVDIALANTNQSQERFKIWRAAGLPVWFQNECTYVIK